MPRSWRLAVGAVLLFGVGACRTLAPAPPADLPDPLRRPAPGASVLSDAESAVYGALAAAARGDVGEANRQLAKLPPGHPVTVLTSIEVDYLEGRQVVKEARELADSRREWPPAWEFLELSARESGDLETALGAARHLALLDPGVARKKTVAKLETDLVSRVVYEGNAALTRGDAAAALEMTQRALEFVPGADEVRLVMARAYLAQDNVARAASLVPALADSPDGLVVKGMIAGKLGQWDLAVSMFERLPSNHAERCLLLTEARQRARLANAPPYVMRALAVREIERRDLAALLMLEVPGLSESRWQRVTVFEDVVDLPEGRDIVTAVRNSLLEGDAVSRRFFPRRKATFEELRNALDRLAAILERKPLVWCADESRHGCVEKPKVLDGTTVDQLIQRVAEVGGIECLSH